MGDATSKKPALKVRSPGGKSFLAFDSCLLNGDGAFLAGSLLLEEEERFELLVEISEQESICVEAKVTKVYADKHKSGIDVSFATADAKLKELLEKHLQGAE